jgi:hypothetical protein
MNGLSIHWNIASLPSPKSWEHKAFPHFETSLHRLHQSRFLRRLEDRLWVLRPLSLHESSLKRLRPSRFFWCPGRTKLVPMASRHFETLLHRLHESRFQRRPEGRLWVLRTIHLDKNSLKQNRPRSFFRNTGFRKCMAFRHLETTLHRLLQNRFLRRPEGRLWILSPIRLLKHHLSESPKSLFAMPGKKLFRMVYGHLETLLHRIHQRRFFRTSRRQIMSSKAHSPT